MLVHEILNTDIAPLNPEDTVNHALLKMDLCGTNRFPVVDGDVLLGLISLENLIAVQDEQSSIAHIPLDDSIHVPQEQHLFEAARAMLAHELYVLPVTGEEMVFRGVIKKQDVLKSIGDIFNLESYGSVLVIEMMPYDFTLTEIVRLIETEGAKILGIAVEQPKLDQEYYRISVKLNLEDSSSVSSTLQRFGYVITSEVSSSVMQHDFSERADELIRYLDI